MSKRKPLSADEKKIKLLELFHESNDVFQLKDLERLAPQEKGIVLQSVKSTLQLLVDDGLVQSGKICGSLYFWSFQSDNLQKLQRQLDDIESNIAKTHYSLETAQKELLINENAMEDLAEVEVITREIGVLVKERESLINQLQHFQSVAEPEDLKEKERDGKKLLEAANRWTDNIFMTKTWCKRKFDKQDKELNKAFGIPGDLDYVED